MVNIYIQEGNTIIADKKIDEMLNASIDSAFGTIVEVIIGILFLFLFFRKLNLKEMFKPKENKMTLKKFIALISIFLGGQLVFNLVGIIIEEVFNLFGYSVYGEIETASSLSTTVSMLIYASFLGPIVEEVIYRGFLLNSLKKYGKVFSIVFSAVMFDFMHGNIAQLLFAIYVGLILGYIALEYSIKWSILFHIINNFIFGYLFGYFLSVFSNNIQYIIFYLVQFILFVMEIRVLYKYRENIKGYIKKNNQDKSLYKVAFTSVFAIIFILLNILVMFDGFVLLK